MHNGHKETQLKNSVDRTRAQRNLSLRTPLDADTSLLRTVHLVS